jgi:O-antigen/teichoic acid export membrane protein
MSATESHASKVTSRRAVADVAVQIGGQAINVALGIVTTVVIVRSLGTDRYGEWATILAAIDLVALFGNLGFETVAVRFAAQDPAREGAWVAAATGLRLLVSIPIQLAFLIVLVLIAGDTEMLIAGVILSVLYYTSIVGSLRVVFQLRVRNKTVAAVGLLNGVLWAAAVIAIAAAGGGLIAFAIAFVAIAVVTQGGLALLALREMPINWRGSRRLWRQVVAVGISVGVAGTLTFAYGRIDQLLLYELAPHQAEIGIYAAMYKILETVGFIPAALMTTLFPIMAGLHPSNPDRLRRIMQLAIDYLLIVSVGGVALTAAAAKPIVELLFGPSFASGAAVLTVLMASFVPICVGYVAGNMIIATDQQRRYIWYAAAGLVLNLSANAILIPSYGMHAAAWVTLATEILVVGLSLRAVLRRIEMSLDAMKILTAVVPAIVAGAAVWGLRQAGAGAILLVLAMAVLYPVLLLASGAINRDDVQALLRNRQSPEKAA